MEAMAIESMVASVWRLQGFLPIVRHPIRVERGYSDVDVIGIRGDGVIRIAECKSGGPAREVYVESEEPSWSLQFDNTLENVRRLWEQRPAWLPEPEAVDKVEFHLVGNVWFADEQARRQAQSRLAAELKKRLPYGLKTKGSAHVFASVELLLQAVTSIRTEVVDNHWGKRYGDPLLDALRELVRYGNPLPKGTHGAREDIRDEFMVMLEEAIFSQE